MTTTKAHESLGAEGRPQRSETAHPLRRDRRRGAGFTGAGVVRGVLLVLGLTACSDLLSVDLPGSVEGESLNNPALAQTLVNSAVGQFECAYTSYVATTGILSGEYINASSWLNINSWGWRGLEVRDYAGLCPTGRDASDLGAYTPLQQARYLAEEATRLIEGFPEAQVAKKSEKLGMLAAYAGYSYLLLGEGFCEMAIDRGPLLTPRDVLQTAEKRFTAAITHAEAAGTTDLRLLALAGRARTRLDLGNLAGAAADAEQISEGFAWNARYSTVDARRENRLYNLNIRNRFLSVEPTAYGNVRIGGVADPRVPATNTGRTGHDGVTVHWAQGKYPTADSPIPMASWYEAQLILAEARPAEAAAAINRLRARRGLPAYEPSGDVLADVVEERRRELFSQGHRLNDMLRHKLPFAQGSNHKGQAYGPTTCMPLPEVERKNNPNL